MFGLYPVWEAVAGKRMALPSVHRCVQVRVFVPLDSRKVALVFSSILLPAMVNFIAIKNVSILLNLYS
ncbi:hypothetical protein E2320_011250, partial [Naja naja]